MKNTSIVINMLQGKTCRNCKRFEEEHSKDIFDFNYQVFKCKHYIKIPFLKNFYYEKEMKDDCICKHFEENNENSC